MDDTQKMLRAIINGQTTLKQELLNEVKKVAQKVDEVDMEVKKVDKKLDKVERNLTGRMDKIGKQLAYLEDDAPTREEHYSLVGRVDKLEQKIISPHIPGA